MLSIRETLAAQADGAIAKAADIRRPDRYLLSSALAGAYVGVGVVLLMAVTGPLLVAASPMTKLVQGLVFGVALTVVIFAGSELATGCMMTMVQGLASRRTGVIVGVTVIVFAFVGNLVGSVVFAWLVHESGIIGSGATPGHAAAGTTILAAIIKGKTAETGTQLFFRGVLCNFLVCLAVWMSARTKSDGAKIALIFWCLLAFIGSGFEHSVANMTVFSLGMFEHTPLATASAFARNMLYVGLGNLVGGGLLVGAVYGFLGQREKQSAPVVEPEAELIPTSA
jgi:nitrite transporter NirC